MSKKPILAEKAVIQEELEQVSGGALLNSELITNVNYVAQIERPDSGLSLAPSSSGRASDDTNIIAMLQERLRQS